MTPQMLESFTVILNDMLEKTMSTIRNGMEELAGEMSLPPDIADRASMESERNFALLMRERDRQALVGIRDALGRIRSGEYGICERCEEDIAAARLKAQPMATLCVHCQAHREDEERTRKSTVSSFFLAARGGQAAPHTSFRAG